MVKMTPSVPGSEKKGSTHSRMESTNYRLYSFGVYTLLFSIPAARMAGNNAADRRTAAIDKNFLPMFRVY